MVGMSGPCSGGTPTPAELRWRDNRSSVRHISRRTFENRPAGADLSGGAGGRQSQGSRLPRKGDPFAGFSVFGDQHEGEACLAPTGTQEDDVWHVTCRNFG